MFLIVIKPPNNAETALRQMKLEIYRQTDMLSAWALSPFVPLVSADTCDLRPSRKQLPELPETGLELKSPGPAEGQYCLGSGGLRSFCRDTAQLFEQEAGFSLSLCGLHLFDSAEQSGGQSAVAVELCKTLADGMDESVMNWKSCFLEIYRTDTNLFKGREWWKRVEYETVYSISFPKARRR